MIQEQEQRRVYYDKDLKIEAYNLSGVVQKFPNHFHECYVIGFIEGGCRHLWCRGSEYDLSRGDLILFNPRDNHYCAPIDGEPLDYRAVNIDPSVMEQAVSEITGREFMPRFTQNVVYRSDITQSVSALYGAILRRATRLEKEEALFFLLEQVLQELRETQGAVMPALQKAQEIFGYLPIEVQQRVAAGLGVSLEEVYGVATFYSQFTLNPKGQYKVSVCLGTACYVKGSGDIYNALKEKLGIDGGECTADGKFSLDACRCIGACGLAPVITINDEVYGRLIVDDLDEILARYK